MSEKQIAHVRKFEDGSWAAPHFLTDPLKNTATLAAVFSAKFNAESWGRACGYSHDVGKGRQQWQKFLSGKSGYSYDEEAHLDGKAGKMPHAIHGAALAEKLYGKGVGRLLAYCIAGHQTGLPDWSNAMGTGRSTFKLLGLTEDLQ